MATEYEELVLRVRLDDHASAQLRAIHTHLGQLGSGPIDSALKRITGTTNETTKAMAELGKSFLGVGKEAMAFAQIIGPWPVMLGLIGIKLIEHFAHLRENTQQYITMSNAARTAGMRIGEMKNIANQMAQAGIPFQQAVGMIDTFNQKLYQLGIAGNPIRENLIRIAGTENAAGMLRFIDLLRQTKDVREQINITRRAMAYAEEKDFERFHNRRHAALTAEQVGQELGLRELILLKGDIAAADEKDLQRQDKEEQKMIALNAQLAKEAEVRGRIKEIVDASLASWDLKALKFLTRMEMGIAKYAETVASGDYPKIQPRQGVATSRGNVPGPGRQTATGGTGFNPGWWSQHLPHLQQGGIVTQPTMAVIGEGGPEMIIPLGTQTKHVQTVEDNTRELQKLNDQIQQALDQLAPLGRAGGGAGTYGPGGYGSGAGGYGYGPNGVGPGVGPGAQQYAPSAANLEEMARTGMNPMWDDPNIRSAATAQRTALARATAGGGLTTGGFPGAPRAAWPGSPIGPAGGTSQGYTGGAGGKSAVAGVVADEWGKAGMSEAGIAGVLANIQEESAFDPTLRHPDQPHFSGEAHFAHGLYQEGGTEWNNYSAWLQKNYPGQDWRDPRLQSRFAAWNLKNNYPKVWEAMRTGDAQAAAASYTTGYLKPAVQYQQSRIAGFRQRGIPTVASYGVTPTPGGGYTAPGAVVPGGGTSGGAGATGTIPTTAATGAGGRTGLTNEGPLPLHQSGMVTMNVPGVGPQQYGWGSGSGRGAHPSLPWGDYWVNIGNVQGLPGGVPGGGVGTEGAKQSYTPQGPAVAGLDPSSQSGNLRGFEIHAGTSNDLDRLYTLGCFGIKAADWPAFKSAILAKAQAEGKLQLHLHPGPDGRPVATITSAKDGPLVVAGQPTAGLTAASTGAPQVTTAQSRVEAFTAGIGAPGQPWATGAASQGPGAQRAASVAGSNDENSTARSEIDKAQAGEVGTSGVKTHGKMTIHHRHTPGSALMHGYGKPKFRDVPAAKQGMMEPAKSGPVGIDESTGFGI